MKEKDMKKLNRYQLLELLIMQTERADKLQNKLDMAEKLLTAKELHISNLGSLAEAAMELHGVIQAAQAAADHYLDAAQKKAVEMETEARQQAEETLAQAKAKALEIENDAQRRAAIIIAQAHWRKGE